MHQPYGMSDSTRGRRKTTGRIRGSSLNTEAAARDMRRDMTPQEQRLWEALRLRQLGGLRFRAQHPLGPFILDFCCPALKFVIEVDGAVHDSSREYDTARTEHLALYGYRVLRIRNDEIDNDLPGVLRRILLVVSSFPAP